jgi:DNA topoisomerase VI subunit B
MSLLQAGVLAKELVDNALDECEQVGIAPDIGICSNAAGLAVSDNGSGIPAEVVTRILDFSSRTIDKAT